MESFAFSTFGNLKIKSFITAITLFSLLGATGCNDNEADNLRAQLQTAQDEKDTAENNLAILNNQHQTAVANAAQLSAQVNNLSNQAQQDAASLQQLTNQVQTLTTQVSTSQNQAAANATLVTKLRGILKQKGGSLKQTQAQLGQAHAQNGQLQTQVTASQAQVTQAQQQMQAQGQAHATAIAQLQNTLGQTQQDNQDLAQTVADRTVRIQTLAQDKYALSQQVKAEKTAKKAAGELLKRANKEIADLKKESEDQAVVAERLMSQLATEKIRRAEKSTKNRKLKQKLREVEDEIERARTLGNASDVTIADLKSEIKKLDSENTLLKGEIAAKLSEIRVLGDDQSTERKKLTAALKSEQEKREKTEATLSELRDQLEDLRQKAERDVAAHSKRIGDLETALSDQAASFDKKLRAADELIQDLKGKNKSALEQLAAASAEIEKQKLEIDTARTQYKELESQKNDVATRLLAVGQTLDRLRDENTQIKGERDALSIQKVDLAKTLQLKVKELESANNDLVKLRELMERNAQSGKATEANAKELERKLGAAEDKLLTAEKKLTEASKALESGKVNHAKELTALQSQVSEIEASARVLNAEVLTLKTENAKLLSDNGKLQQILQDTKDEKADLDKRLKLSTTALEDAGKELERAKAEASLSSEDSQTQSKALKDRLSATEQRLEATEQRLREAESALTSAQLKHSGELSAQAGDSLRLIQELRVQIQELERGIQATKASDERSEQKLSSLQKETDRIRGELSGVIELIKAARGDANASASSKNTSASAQLQDILSGFKQEIQTASSQKEQLQHDLREKAIELEESKKVNQAVLADLELAQKKLKSAEETARQKEAEIAAQVETQAALEKKIADLTFKIRTLEERPADKFTEERKQALGNAQNILKGRDLRTYIGETFENVKKLKTGKNKETLYLSTIIALEPYFLAKMTATEFPKDYCLETLTELEKWQDDAADVGVRSLKQACSKFFEDKLDLGQYLDLQRELRNPNHFAWFFGDLNKEEQEFKDSESRVRALLETLIAKQNQNDSCSFGKAFIDFFGFSIGSSGEMTKGWTSNAHHYDGGHFYFKKILLDVIGLRFKRLGKTVKCRESISLENLEKIIEQTGTQLSRTRSGKEEDFEKECFQSRFFALYAQLSENPIAACRELTQSEKLKEDSVRHGCQEFVYHYGSFDEFMEMLDATQNKTYFTWKAKRILTQEKDETVESFSARRFTALRTFFETFLRRTQAPATALDRLLTLETFTNKSGYTKETEIESLKVKEALVGALQTIAEQLAWEQQPISELSKETMRALLESLDHQQYYNRDSAIPQDIYSSVLRLSIKTSKNPAATCGEIAKALSPVLTYLKREALEDILFDECLEKLPSSEDWVNTVLLTNKKSNYLERKVDKSPEILKTLATKSLNAAAFLKNILKIDSFTTELDYSKIELLRTRLLLKANLLKQLNANWAPQNVQVSELPLKEFLSSIFHGYDYAGNTSKLDIPSKPEEFTKKVFQSLNKISSNRFEVCTQTFSVIKTSAKTFTHHQRKHLVDGLGNACTERVTNWTEFKSILDKLEIVDYFIRLSDPNKNVDSASRNLFRNLVRGENEGDLTGLVQRATDIWAHLDLEESKIGKVKILAELSKLLFLEEAMSVFREKQLTRDQGIHFCSAVLLSFSKKYTDSIEYHFFNRGWYTNEKSNIKVDPWTKDKEPRPYTLNPDTRPIDVVSVQTLLDYCSQNMKWIHKSFEGALEKIRVSKNGYSTNDLAKALREGVKKNIFSNSDAAELKTWDVKPFTESEGAAWSVSKVQHLDPIFVSAPQYMDFERTVLSPEETHSENFLKNWEDIIVGTTEFLDMTTLAYPQDKFLIRLKAALAKLDAKGNNVKVRILFANNNKAQTAPYSAPFDLKKLLKDLTTGLKNLTVTLGNVDNTSVNPLSDKEAIVTWNHGKLTVSDEEDYTGGANYYENYHTADLTLSKWSPTHDLTVRFPHNTAEGAHLFAEAVWDKIKEFQKHWYTNPRYLLGLDSGYSYTMRPGDNEPVYDPTAIPSYEKREKPPVFVDGKGIAETTLMVSRFSNLKEAATFNVSDFAMLDILTEAKHSVFIAQQSLLPLTDIDLKVTGFKYVARFTEKFVDRLVWKINQGVDVFVLMSSFDHNIVGEGNLGLSGGYDPERAALYLLNWVKKRPQLGIKEEEFIPKLLRHFHAVVTRNGTQEVPNHSKVVIVDGNIGMMGSHNTYDGSHLENEKVMAELLTRRMTTEYFAPYFHASIGAYGEHTRNRNGFPQPKDWVYVKRNNQGIKTGTLWTLGIVKSIGAGGYVVNTAPLNDGIREARPEIPEELMEVVDLGDLGLFFEPAEQIPEILN